MKTLIGADVEANVKLKGAPRPDANSSAIVDSVTEDVPKTNHPHDAHPSSRRSLSAENDNAAQAQKDMLQTVNRQESDIIAVFQSLDALRKEMKHYQKELESVKVAVSDVRARQDEQYIPEFTEEIDLLTETVLHVRAKVGELDDLKLEGKMMQSRVKRLEEDKRGNQTNMEVPSTPRSTTNTGRTIKLTQKAEELLSNNDAYSPRRSMPLAGAKSNLDRLRAASVHGGQTPRTHKDTDMPPPDLPRSQLSRNSARPSSTSSTSGTGHNVNSQHNVNHASSTTKDGAGGLPTLTGPDDEEDSDKEYREGVSSADPDEEAYRPPRSRSRQSLPTRMAPSEDLLAEDRHDATSSNKRRRTTSHALTRDNNTPPSPHPDDPNYTSIWAAPSAGAADPSDRDTPAPVVRNQHGFIIKPNGQVDKRSLRFLGQTTGRRRTAQKDAARDSEGYLLLEDGTRNPRSVRIINGMKKNDKRRDRPPAEES